MFKVGDKVRRISMGGMVLPIGAVRIVQYVDHHRTHAHQRLDFGDGFGWWAAYNFELVEDSPKPHKWAHLIKIWADNPDTVFQWRQPTGYQPNTWHDTTSPPWEALTLEFRVKPEKKPDCRVPLRLKQYKEGCVVTKTENDNNFVATFDGETGKLKAVALLGE